MAEQKIVVDISETGEITAETFGFYGVGCMNELDKLLKDLALETKIVKKPEYFKEGVSSDNTIKVNQK